MTGKANLAVLGATGVVGRHILEILKELEVPYNTIKFLSSKKSAGSKITFDGKEYTVEEATPESFDGVNVVLASAGGSTSKMFAPEIVKRGGVIIDNSSAFRMDKDVPLVMRYSSLRLNYQTVYILVCQTFQQPYNSRNQHHQIP